MNVLLLRLIAPMQSWGVQSRFSIRDTGLEPSKSGVIGLLCAALGRPRHASIADLATLRMGVRVDREGKVAYDFHTAQNVLKASGGNKDTEPSRRYYLADAAFMVGLEHPELAFLQSINHALQNPVWPLYLGRKAFVPSEPIWQEDGIKAATMLEVALQPDPPPTRPLRLVIEDKEGSEVRPDQPVCFISDQRQFAPRRVATSFTSAQTRSE
jgi:CRISPR system Cascade subunit CasD